MCLRVVTAGVHVRVLVLTWPLEVPSLLRSPSARQGPPSQKYPWDLGHPADRDAPQQSAYRTSNEVINKLQIKELTDYY